MANLTDVKAKVARNLAQKSYRPLAPDESRLIRDFYASQISLGLNGNPNTHFYTRARTHIATGYNRVVVGDYGAYVEFTKDQLNMSMIRSKWPGEPRRPVKYIWLEVQDHTKAKVYEQRGTVKYADYKVGMYYISPDDVVF